MIYTVGHRPSYERYFEEDQDPRKLGRTEDYPGGSVWNTEGEARAYLDSHPELDYQVYGVEADWERDTQDIGEPWHALQVTSRLVRLGAAN